VGEGGRSCELEGASQEMGTELPRISMERAEEVRAAISRGEPFILTGLRIGPCVGKWSPEYLRAAAAAKHLAAGVHVCPFKTVDLAGHRKAGTRKNFHFVEMPFGEFIQRCAPEAFADMEPLAPVLEAGERLYLRSVATGPEAARTPSHLEEVFPELAADVCLPHGVLYEEGECHSSVLRVASGDTELWTHYDVMHNMLIQVTGTKRVTLWPPSEDANLYTEGSSSRVPDIHAPDLARFPRFARTHSSRVTGLLAPGDAVFIPPLWFHHVAMPDFSVAVNVFWRHHPGALYNPKDIYGNKDLPAFDAASAAVSKLGQELKKLPEPFRSFYARRAAAQLLASAGICGCEETRIAHARVPAAAAAAKRLLSGRVCVVTGANRGIGREVALALAARGGTVVMVCRDAQAGARAAAAVSR